MLEHDTKFREIKFTLPPDSLKVLRAAASNIKNGNRDAVLICRLHVPGLSYGDAQLFLKWLAKHPM
jgi:hypothetical protein